MNPTTRTYGSSLARGRGGQRAPKRVSEVRRYGTRPRETSTVCFAELGQLCESDGSLTSQKVPSLGSPERDHGGALPKSQRSTFAKATPPSLGPTPDPDPRPPPALRQTLAAALLTPPPLVPALSNLQDEPPLAGVSIASSGPRTVSSGPPRQLSDFQMGVSVMDQLRGDGEVLGVTAPGISRKGSVHVRFANGFECEYFEGQLEGGVLQPAAAAAFGRVSGSVGGTPRSDRSVTPRSIPAGENGLEAPLLRRDDKPRKSSLAARSASGGKKQASSSPLVTLLQVDGSADGDKKEPPSPDGSDGNAADQRSEYHRRRSRHRITTVVEARTGVKKGSALRVAGVDLLRLKEAFGELDHEGEGGLVVDQFRRLWRTVFPGRPVDAATWEVQQELFDEIDTDGKGIIGWKVLINYLEHHCEEELQRKKRPKAIQDWCWQLAGPEAQFDWADGPLDRWLVRCITLWKIISQVLVVVSIGLILIETMPSMQEDGEESVGLGNDTTAILEIVCVCFFSLELIFYLIGFPRVVVRSEGAVQPSSDEDEGGAAAAAAALPTDDEPQTVKCRPLMTDLNTWIDLLSVLPFYISRAVEFATEAQDSAAHNATPLAVVRVARLFRLLRVLRILKIGRGKFGRVPQLGGALRRAIVSVYFLGLLIIITICLSSCFVFYAELDECQFNGSLDKWIRRHDSQYDDAGKAIDFQSIPSAMWWGIVTLTTVGYGDQTPITPLGKLIASGTMLTGLIVVGFPITILTSTFQAMEVEREEQERRTVRCREFYQGILWWLRDGGRLSKDDGFSSLRRDAGTGSPRGWGRHHREGSLNGSPRVLESRQFGGHDDLVERFAKLERLLLNVERRVIQRVDAVEDELKRISASIWTPTTSPIARGPAPAVPMRVGSLELMVPQSAHSSSQL
eukprot:TRINITY_DN4436_c0_g2_i1.p1 TRINITY_DN4436_c0_g2~~TRINITY_DN4436_c0_g2_i1.p1  ORF type:complete len:908 (+),score=259.13 TRINITY_DN4436_c0_g2_i1:133-2856(+)